MYYESAKGDIQRSRTKAGAGNVYIFLRVPGEPQIAFVRLRGNIPAPGSFAYPVM
jgi:hypothetical protein